MMNIVIFDDFNKTSKIVSLITLYYEGISYIRSDGSLNKKIYIIIHYQPFFFSYCIHHAYNKYINILMNKN